MAITDDELQEYYGAQQQRFVVVMQGRRMGKQVMTKALMEMEEAEPVQEPAVKKPWHREAWRSKKGKGRCR